MGNTLIYIHGFASVGNSSKARLLRSTFRDLKVLSPTLSPDTRLAIEQIKKILLSAENPILIGSSLGGFYVDYFNTLYNIPSMLINPLVDSTLIKAYLGENTNLYTNKTFDFTLESYNYLQQLNKEKVESDNYLNRKNKMVILLAKDDDVIDYRTAQSEYDHDNQQVYTYDTGGHRFTNTEAIISKVKELFI